MNPLTSTVFALTLTTAMGCSQGPAHDSPAPASTAAAPAREAGAPPVTSGAATPAAAAAVAKSGAGSSVATTASTPSALSPASGSTSSAATLAPLADPTRAAAAPAVPEYREVTIPAGTVLPVELATAVASDTSHVEDPVRGTLRRAVTVGGVQALAAGAVLTGHVTAADASARVKGRARIAVRFTTVDPPGDAERVSIQTAAVSQLAPATKKQDAAKIGGGAVGGAIIGGILGGGDGAAKGAAIGGAAGTGVVLSTKGQEVRLAPGTAVSVRLTQPVGVRVRVAH